jgi:hypothetical protein
VSPPTLLGIYLAICLLAFGAPAYWLAGERGRSTGIWFILGLLLGPIALFMLAFSPVLPAGKYEACPECLEAILLGATSCPYCASNLIPDDDVNTRPTK